MADPVVNVEELLEKVRKMFPVILDQIKALMEMFKSLGLSDAQVKAELAVITKAVQEYQTTY